MKMLEFEADHTPYLVGLAMLIISGAFFRYSILPQWKSRCSGYRSCVILGTFQVQIPVRRLAILRVSRFSSVSQDTIRYSALK
jgi:hypothetical protein